MKSNDVPSNVVSLINNAAGFIGRLEQDRFSQDMWDNCYEGEITSPIEQCFWVACHAMCRSEWITVNPEISHEFHGDKNPYRESRIFIQPQAVIGKFRVDFLISAQGIGPEEILTPIVVELDGHDFHDKDKRQRSYEKARDRFLVKEGYRVLHFTGSDVVKDPFKVAYEALDLLGVFSGSLREYNSTDPLGLDG